MFFFSLCSALTTLSIPKLVTLQVLEVQKEERWVLPSCLLLPRFLYFVKDSLSFSSLSLLTGCPLGHYLVMWSVERFRVEWEHWWGYSHGEPTGLKAGHTSGWQSRRCTSTGLYLQAEINAWLEGELWDKHRFSETLPLNSALEMLIVSPSLRFVDSVSWPSLFYPRIVTFESHSCSKVFLFTGDAWTFLLLRWGHHLFLFTFRWN